MEKKVPHYFDFLNASHLKATSLDPLTPSFFPAYDNAADYLYSKSDVPLFFLNDGNEYISEGPSEKKIKEADEIVKAMPKIEEMRAPTEEERLQIPSFQAYQEDSKNLMIMRFVPNSNTPINEGSGFFDRLLRATGLR